MTVGLENPHNIGDVIRTNSKPDDMRGRQKGSLGYIGEAPTQSLLQKWLRLKHGIQISMIPVKGNGNYYIGSVDHKPLGEFGKYEVVLEKVLINALNKIA